MLKSSHLLSLLVLTGLPTMSCRKSSSKEPKVSPEALRQSSWRFVQQTNLLGAVSDESSSGGSGGYSPSPFPSTYFWPSTPLVVPARAAAYINANYGAAGGFTYQSFEFTGTGCSASNAYARYFGAIEQLRGAPLSRSDKDAIEIGFQNAFSPELSGSPNAGACIIYDLMACIADYMVHNEAVFKQTAQAGDFGAILVGATSCVAEVMGTDPTDTIDPSDSSTNLPDE